MGAVDTWGAFTIGTLVAATLFVLYIFYDNNLGAWLPDGLTEDKSKAFWRNVSTAFNPITNVVEVFWRPAVTGIGGSKLGSGKTLASLADMQDDVKEDEGRMRGLDGVRALAFLWVTCYEVNSMLRMLDDDYKATKWSRIEDEQVFPWKLGGQGYEGLSVFIVLSAFLFAWANITSQSEAPSALEDSSFTRKYMSVYWRRLSRMWPAMAAAVLFVGFLWPTYVNPSNDVIQDKFLGKCEETWWTDMFFIGNFFKEDCFNDLWAVSLIFQLSFLAPLPCWLFAQGDTKRTYAYLLVYFLIAVSLGARAFTVWYFDIALGPVGDYEHLNKFWLQRMPWARAGEYLVGVLVCFSVFDEKDDESPSYLNVFKIVGETFKDWLADSRLLFTTTVQTATLCSAFFFMYEGTLQWFDMNINYDNAGAFAILVAGDLIVAGAMALLVRWSISGLHGSWLKSVLSSPVWYPVACLSYSGFLFLPATTYWATVVLAQDYGHDIKAGYLYFSKVYFLTVTLALGVALVVNVCIEKPLIKLSQLK